jgi:hypothetical protein
MRALNFKYPGNTNNALLIERDNTNSNSSRYSRVLLCIVSYITYIIRVYSQSVCALTSIDMVRVYHSFILLHTLLHIFKNINH